MIGWRQAYPGYFGPNHGTFRLNTFTKAKIWSSNPHFALARCVSKDPPQTKHYRKVTQLAEDATRYLPHKNNDLIVGDGFAFDSRVSLLEDKADCASNQYLHSGVGDPKMLADFKKKAMKISLTMAVDIDILAPSRANLQPYKRRPQFSSWKPESID